MMIDDDIDPKVKSPESGIRIRSQSDIERVGSDFVNKQICSIRESNVNDLRGMESGLKDKGGCRMERMFAIYTTSSNNKFYNRYQL